MCSKYVFRLSLRPITQGLLGLLAAAILNGQVVSAYVIGIDFGANSNNDNYNEYTFNADSIAVSTTVGESVDGVTFEATGLTHNGINREIGNSGLTTGSDVWGDYCYSNVANQPVTLRFTGLDDSVTYSFFGGQDRDKNAENFDATYVLTTGTTAESDNFLSDATVNHGYGTISGITPSGGVIAMTLTPVDDDVGNEWIGVAVVTLTTEGPRPGPVLPSEEVAVIFDPVEGDGSVNVQDLNDMTIGGAWTASGSDVGQFEDNSGGFAYVMDAGNAEADFIELTLDAGLDFSSSEIAINFQMLASRSSGGGDKGITLIGYDGATEVFRLNYVSHSNVAQSTLTVTTDDGDESMGFTPLRAIAPPSLPSGFQDFRIVISNGHVHFSGSSLTAQGGAAMNSTTTLTGLRWEVTGTSTGNQGFWLDDLIIRDQPASAPRSVTDRPNVIFILMDDMGFKDVSCYGATVVDTPNIDSLASGGLQFTDFHSGSSICSPSRAAFLTGAYPQRCGLPYGINESRESHWFMGLSPNEITLAEQFRNRGYKTMMIGKWHLGSQDLFSYYNQGFEHYYGAPSNLTQNKEFLDETEHVFNVSNDDAESRLSSLYTQRVREHIRNYRDRPFFLFYSHQYPHTPYTEGNAFDGSTGNGTRADVLKEVDWSVGQLVAELEANGILENTLLVFASDNGAIANQYCRPYRGTKFVTWEGGQRVPFILYWKGQIQTPAVLDSPQAVAMDLFPTLCEIIGEPLPTDRVYDGVSLVPLFTGGSINRAADEPFYYYNGENLQAVRQGDWKLHLPRASAERPFWDNQSAHDEYRLFNLTTDGGESNDVSDSNPSIVADLTALAGAIEPRLGAYMSRGSEQRETGSLFPEVRIVQNLTDWNNNSLLTDVERGRGRTLFNQNGIALGGSFIDGSTLPGGWQYLESSEAQGGIETALTAGVTVGSEGNMGFAGFDASVVLGSADVGSFVIDTGNGGNSAVVGTDLLLRPDANNARDHVIIRYTVSEADVALGHILADISGSFRDLVGGTSGDSVTAQVFHRGVELFAASGTAGQLSQADGKFNLSDVVCEAGDTIDFVLGSKGDRIGDEVALRVTLALTQVTEVVHDLWLDGPSTMNFAEGRFSFGFNGTPGLSYRVEKTTDLTDRGSWEVVDEIPFLPTSVYNVNFEADEHDVKAFWRIRAN